MVGFGGFFYEKFTSQMECSLGKNSVTSTEDVLSFVLETSEPNSAVFRKHLKTHFFCSAFNVC